MEQAPEPGQHQRGLLGQADGREGPGQVQQCRGALHPEVLQGGGAVENGNVRWPLHTAQVSRPRGSGGLITTTSRNSRRGSRGALFFSRKKFGPNGEGEDMDQEQVDEQLS